jgi:hypothetical protein
MTRARFELHLVVQPRSPKGGGGRTFAALLAGRLGSGGGAEAARGGAVLYEDGSPIDGAAIGSARGSAAVEGTAAEAAAATDIENAAGAAASGAPLGALRSAGPRTAGAGTRRARSVLAPSELGTPSEVTVAELLRREPAAATARGRVLHEWLRGIEWLDDSSGVIAPLDEAWLLRAARRIDPAASEARLVSLLAEFRRLLAQEPLRAILTRPESAGRDARVEVWRERSFLAERDGVLYRGVFDRVVVHSARGVPVFAELFEWKTESAPTETGSDAGPSPAHAAQLDAYRDCLATMLGLLATSVEARLVYLAAGGGAGS